MAVFAFLAALACAVFLVLAARWLLVLRRTALDAHLPLTPLDKLVAAAPIGYTVLCFLAAGVLADFAGATLAGGAATAAIPLFGVLERGQAIWALGLLTGLAVATPPIVVFTVEWRFARRMPQLVALGRAAVWSTLTGVRAAAPPAASTPREESEDDRWKRLLA